MSFKIYLSPAAHGNDNPCSFDRANCGENVHCNLYMDELEPILVACGFDVKRNPKDRTGDKLHLAIEEANAWGADLYYVCHTNAGGGAYSKLMVYDHGTGYTYAEKIKAQQHTIYTNPINITVEPKWAEINQTDMPCVYHEMVFHDNIDEITYFHHHFRDFAICVAKGICDCFGVTFVNPYEQTVPDQISTTATPTANSSTSSGIQAGDTVHYSGRVYADSYGNGAGLTVDGDYTVDRVIDGRQYGVHIAQGWIEIAACSKDGESSSSALSVGDTVRIRDGVTTFTDGTGIASFIRSATLYVRQIGDGKVLVSTQASGDVTGWVKSGDIVRA